MATSTAYSEASPGQLAQLHAEAWARYRSACLWNVKRFDPPTPEVALRVAARLRRHGDMDAHRLAERLTEAALAA